MPAREGCLAAVDIGTTTTRCVLYDLKGRPVEAAYREPVVHHPRTNWTEVEPEDWWLCAAAAIREALERSGVPNTAVLGVGLCGLKHAIVPLDAQGTPLARSMLWMDQRCQPQAEWMTREHGDAIAASTGGGPTMSTTPSAPKLRWIAEHQPDLLQRAQVLLLVKDFVRFRLTGTLATDPSDAGGTRLYDPRTGDWSQRMLDLVGVPREKMPPICEPTSVAGGVTECAARATGLQPGTPVVVGGGDVQCTLIGANAYGMERACLYLGTAAWLSVARSTSSGSFGATSTTGAALKWLSLLLGYDQPGHTPASYSVLVVEAERSPAGARGLTFLPHLMGERGPEDDPEAKGVLYGLSLAHRREDVARAVLEGCAFQLRRIAESLEPCGIGEAVVVGGGAKSPLWLQIIADVTGTALLRPRALEAGALGAAILAGVGVGVYPSIRKAAQDLVRIEGRTQPDEGRRAQYDGLYSLFLDLEESVAPLYRRGR